MVERSRTVDVLEEAERVDMEVVRMLRDLVVDGLPHMHLAGKLYFSDEEP